MRTSCNASSDSGFEQTTSTGLDGLTRASLQPHGLRRVGEKVERQVRMEDAASISALARTRFNRLVRRP